MGGRLNASLLLFCFALLFAVAALSMLTFPPSVVSAAPGSTITLSGHPEGVALDYSNHYLYIANNNGYVLVVDPSTGTLVKNITTGGYLTHIAYDNSTGHLYVADFTSGMVIIDDVTNTVIGHIPTPGFFPFGVTYARGEIFVIGYASGTGQVRVLNPQTGKFVANVTVGSGPALGAYDPQNKRLYVTNYNSNTTSVIDTDTNTVVATIPVPNNPLGIEYAPGKVYVTEYSSNVTAVIDTSTNKIVKNLTVGFHPDSVAYSGDPVVAITSYGDPGQGVTNFFDPFTDEPVGTVDTPNGPQMIIYDHFLQEFFVVEYYGYLQGIPLGSITSTTTSSTSTTTSTTYSVTSMSSITSQASATSSTTASSSSTTATSSSETPPLSTAGGISPLWLGGILVAVIFVGLVYYLWRRGSSAGLAYILRRDPCASLRAAWEAAKARRETAYVDYTIRATHRPRDKLGNWAHTDEEWGEYLDILKKRLDEAIEDENKAREAYKRCKAGGPG